MRVCRIMEITQMVHGAFCRVSAGICCWFALLQLHSSYAEIDFDGLV